MADKEKECQGTCSDGVDWEVVSMTASMYDAAPGEIVFSPSNENKDKQLCKNEKEPYYPLFMSSHFVFPSMEDESLKLKNNHSEIDYKFVAEDVISDDDKGNTIKKTLEKSLMSESSENLDAIHLHEKEKILSVSDIDIGKPDAAQEISVILEEPALSSSYTCHDCHAETATSGLFTCGEKAEELKPSYLAYPTPDSATNHSNISAKRDEKISERFVLPCGSWLKRHATAFYSHAKEANIFWSVVVAAALVGLAMLGQRKQRAKPVVQRFKLHFGSNSQVLKTAGAYRPVRYRRTVRYATAAAAKVRAHERIEASSAGESFEDLPTPAPFARRPTTIRRRPCSETRSATGVPPDRL